MLPIHALIQRRSLPFDISADFHKISFRININIFKQALVIDLSIILRYVTDFIVFQLFKALIRLIDVALFAVEKTYLLLKVNFFMPLSIIAKIFSLVRYSFSSILNAPLSSSYLTHILYHIIARLSIDK